MTTSSISIGSISEFDRVDFHSRWARARISALRAVLDDEGGLSPLIEESSLLAVVPESQQDDALRFVFKASWRFGQNVVGRFGLLWETTDLSLVLRDSAIPCVSGNWMAQGHAQVLRRSGCSQNPAKNVFVCDYWREALDGLIMGLCEDVRFSRHESEGRGDASCVDVIYVEAPDGKNSAFRWKRVPAEVLDGLAKLQQNFASSRVDLKLLGVSENILYYRLESSAGPLCGAGGKLMHESFSREVSRRFPHLETQDASPLAVYGGSD